MAATMIIDTKHWNDLSGQWFFNKKRSFQFALLRIGIYSTLNTFRLFYCGVFGPQPIFRKIERAWALTSDNGGSRRGIWLKVHHNAGVFGRSLKSVRTMGCTRRFASIVVYSYDIVLSAGILILQWESLKLSSGRSDEENLKRVRYPSCNDSHSTIRYFNRNAVCKPITTWFQSDPSIF